MTLDSLIPPQLRGLPLTRLSLLVFLLVGCQVSPPPPRPLSPDQEMANRVCGGGSPAQVIDAPGRIALYGANVRPPSSPALAPDILLAPRPYTHHPIVVRRGALILGDGAVVRCVLCRDGGTLIIEQGKFLLANGCIPKLAPTYARWGPPPFWLGDLATQLAQLGIGLDVSPPEVQ